MGYRFGQFFVPMELPNADPRFAMFLGVAIPWLLFLGFFFVGLLLMRFYRRGLRKYHDLLVSQLIQAKGERQALPVLRQAKIYWPCLALGLIAVGLFFYGDSAQGAVWSMSGFGGLLASVMTTYAERRQLYDDAVNASDEAKVIGGSPSSIRNLPVGVRAQLASFALLLCISFLIIIWFTVQIVVSIDGIQNLAQPQ